MLPHRRPYWRSARAVQRTKLRGEPRESSFLGEIFVARLLSLVARRYRAAVIQRAVRAMCNWLKSWRSIDGPSVAPSQTDWRDSNCRVGRLMQKESHIFLSRPNCTHLIRLTSANKHIDCGSQLIYIYIEREYSERSINLPICSCIFVPARLAIRFRSK